MKDSESELEITLAKFSDFLFASKGLGETTVNNHVTTIRRNFPIIGLRPDNTTIFRFIARMRRDKLSNSYIANTSVALERWGEFMGLPIKLGRAKAPYRLVQGTLTEAEMARLLGACPTLREKAIISLMAYSGLRNGELRCTRISDLNTAAQNMCVHGTKVGRDRVVALPAVCLGVVLEYLNTHKRTEAAQEWLFTTKRNGYQLQTQDIRKIVRLAAVRAKIGRRVFPHLL